MGPRATTNSYEQQGEGRMVHLPLPGPALVHWLHIRGTLRPGSDVLLLLLLLLRRNPGSVDQDPIFQNNKLPSHEVRPGSSGPAGRGAI